MAEENVIQTNIVATSNMAPLIADLNKVTSSLSLLQERLTATNKSLATQAAVMNKAFSETLRSTGQFSTQFVSLTSDVDKFGQQLDRGQLKLGQFFRVYGDHAKNSGGIIRDLAKQQVQLQNSILQPLGRNAEGLMQYNVQIPRGLDMVKNKTAVARQELMIMNRVVQEGAGQLINWGKNTQWAGRQLTVGLTVPIMAFGKAAADAFKQADEQLVRLTKVYGGLGETTSAELQRVRKDVAATAAELAKSYGAGFKDTIALAADIAATGKEGNELLGSVKETTRLSVLGEIDRQEAMMATLAIQTAFKQNTEELTESINFLNSVENQTSTTLNDLVEAIPKAGPVVKGLGGSIQELALYLTAMREGGINASESANALKSGLAALINPTDVAAKKFKAMGIDLKTIVSSNAGNLTDTILGLQSALDRLDPLKKQQALEQLFGKFQFARMNALFANLGKEGSQTLQVLDLMKASSQELAGIADRELSAVTESASGKYRRAVEGLKADLAGIGEQFLKINTTLINVIDSVIKFTQKLPDPVKQALAFMGGLTALAGPLIMLTGVLGNFFGYIIKGVYQMKAFFKGAHGWKLLTPEILAANKASQLIEGTFYSDARAAAVLKQSLDGLISSYSVLASKVSSAGVPVNPAISTIGGSAIMSGRQVNPASQYLSPRDTRSFSHMEPVSNMSSSRRSNQTIFGVVPGAPLVNQKISNNPQMYMDTDLEKIEGLSSIRGVSTGVVAGEAAKFHSMTAALAMQSKAEIAKLKAEVKNTGLVTDEVSVAYQALLPEMTKLTANAAQESAKIVAQLKSGKLTMDQARAKIIALNSQIEAMMVQTATQTAAGLGRTIDVSRVPLLNQPVVDPKTGKTNMKELAKPGRTRDLLNSIARALGVKTYGAPYSIETTMPKRLNQGNIVPGTGNQDTVPAMLTPGEFVVNAKATAANLPLLQAINGGARTAGYNNALGGFMSSRAANAVLRSFGVMSTSAKDAKLLGNWGMLLPNAVNRRLRYKRATGAELRSHVSNSKNLIDVERFLKHNNVSPRDISSIQSKISKEIYSSLSDKDMYDDAQFGRIAFSSISPAIKALESKYPGISLAYQKDRMQPGRRDTQSSSSKHGPSPTGINVPGGRGSSYGSGSGTGKNRSVWAHFGDEEFDANVAMLAQNFNAGGMVSMLGGEVTSQGGRSIPVPPQTGKYNMGGMVAKALSSSTISRLTARWKPQQQFRQPGYQYTLGNQDPLHGPLQIGKTMVPKNMQKDHAWTREVLYQDDRFARQNVMPQFPIGTMEERGKYILRQYMAGNYGILNTPGAADAMKTLSKKFSGTLYRGIRLSDNRNNPLPQNIIDSIEQARLTGDMSRLLGREFIMRRSSWSSDSGVASMFAPGFRADTSGKSIMIEAAVKNRNVVPASEIFPDAKFSAPFGQKLTNNSRSEKESIFGGKFKVVGYSGGKLQLETVVDGARAMGGPVKGGRPYLVGENGPELFVPRNSGGIIPGYNRGGLVGGMGGGMIGQLLMGMLGSQGGQMLGQRVAGESGAMAGNMLGFMLPSMLMGGMGRGPSVGQRLGTSPDPIGPMRESVLANTKLGTSLGNTAVAGNRVTSSLAKLALGATRLNLGLAAVTTAAVIGYKEFKKYREEIALNQASYGLTADSAAKLKVSFTDYNMKIKETIQTTKAMVENNRLLFESMASAGTPFKMTIEQYKEMKKEVKATMQEQIKMINSAKDSEVGDLAVRMKEQFVAAGMSAEEASKKIYIAFNLSKKSGISALATIGNQDFSKITNAQTAMQSAFKTFAQASASEDAVSQANALNTALTSMDSALKEIVSESAKKAKLDKTGKTEAISGYQAEKEMLDQIKSKVKNQVVISKELRKELEKHNPEIKKFINSQDTTISLWQKMRIAATGYTGDLSALNAKATGALYTMTQEIAATTIAANKAKGGALFGQYQELDKLLALQKKYSAATKNQSAADQISAKNRIKFLDEEIEKINEAADARKKALQEQASDEDVLLQIRKAQIQYQEALSSGDMATAAQMQIDIQRLSNEQQRTLAIRAIDEKRDRDIAPLEAEKDRINAAQEALADAATKAADSLDKINARIEDQRNKIDNLNTAMIAYRIAVATGAKDMRGFSAALITAAEAAGIKPTGVTAGGPPDRVGEQPRVATPQETAKALFDQLGGNGIKATNVYLYAQKVFDKQTSGTFKEPIPLGGTNVTGIDPKRLDSPFSGVGVNSIRQQIKKYAAEQGIKPGQFFTMGAGNRDDETYKEYKLRVEKDGNITVIDSKVGGYAMGGLIQGPGTGTSDSIYAKMRYANGGGIYVSNGEHITRASSVKSIGAGNMDLINKFGTDGLMLAASNVIGAKFNIPSSSLLSSGAGQGNGSNINFAPVFQITAAPGMDEKLIGMSAAKYAMDMFNKQTKDMNAKSGNMGRTIR